MITYEPVHSTVPVASEMAAPQGSREASTGISRQRKPGLRISSPATIHQAAVTPVVRPQDDHRPDYARQMDSRTHQSYLAPSRHAPQATGAGLYPETGPEPIESSRGGQATLRPGHDTHLGPKRIDSTSKGHQGRNIVRAPRSRVSTEHQGVNKPNAHLFGGVPAEMGTPTPVTNPYISHLEPETANKIFTSGSFSSSLFEVRHIEST